MKISQTDDNFILVDYSNGVPSRSEGTIIVFDDDYDIILEYEKEFGSALNHLSVSEILSIKPFTPRGYAYPAALAGLLVYFRDQKRIARLVFSDLPRGEMTWESLLLSAQHHVVNEGLLYVLVDCMGRTSAGKETLFMENGESFPATAVRILRDKSIPPSRYAFFTGGWDPAQVPNELHLEQIYEISKERNSFEDKVSGWWKRAQRCIDSTYFQRYTEGRPGLHDPTTAYSLLKTNAADSFLWTLESQDFFGVWRWVRNVIANYGESKPYVCYVYLCAKCFLYSGGDRQPHEYGAKFVDYPALRALIHGLPYALGRERSLTEPFPFEVPDIALREELRDPPVNKAYEGSWGAFALADDSTFQTLAETLFDFLDKANREGEGPSRLTEMNLTGAGKDVATLMLEFQPILPAEIFDPKAKPGTVTVAWRKLSACISRSEIEPVHRATRIKLSFAKVT